MASYQAGTHLYLDRLVRALQVFGMPLIARNHRNGPAWLTEEGQVLLPYCRSMLAVASEACKAMQECQAASVSVVSLGASQTVGTYVMPRLVAAFKRNNSQVRWRCLLLHVCLQLRCAWWLPPIISVSRCVVARLCVCCAKVLYAAQQLSAYAYQSSARCA